jgi:hypothetical protein
MTFQHNYKYAFVIDNNYTSQELFLYYFIDYTNYTKTPWRWVILIKIVGFFSFLLSGKYRLTEIDSLKP